MRNHSGPRVRGGRSSVGHLYAANVLGAALGTLTSALVLIEFFGLRGTLELGAGFNALLAALSLGASGWQIFRWVTMPNIQWGLLYGVILCNARAMGEFGAVSVVSGHIRGLTDTMPLHVEILYNEYNFAAAFAMASLLTLLALITLAAKTLLEMQYGEALARTPRV